MNHLYGFCNTKEGSVKNLEKFTLGNNEKNTWLQHIPEKKKTTPKTKSSNPKIPHQIFTSKILMFAKFIEPKGKFQFKIQTKKDEDEINFFFKNNQTKISNIERVSFCSFNVNT
jgi:hypothetical protein